jgi:hypothetical protein
VNLGILISSEARSSISFSSICCRMFALIRNAARTGEPPAFQV